MMNGKFVSVKMVTDKVYRDTDMNEINWEAVLEWVWEATAKIGSPTIWIDKFCYLTIEDYKAELPCDLYKITQVREGEYHAPMIMSTDTFHKHLLCDEDQYDHTVNDCDDSLTYKISNYHIFTNFREGSVEISYRAFPVDDDGLPMIADEQAVIDAVAAYITYKEDYKKWRADKLSDKVFAKSEQEWLFYVKSARNKSRMPSIDQMESLKRQYLRLIPNIHRHDSQFKTLNNKEQRHNKTTF